MTCVLALILAVVVVVVVTSGDPVEAQTCTQNGGQVTCLFTSTEYNSDGYSYAWTTPSDVNSLLLTLWGGGGGGGGTSYMAADQSSLIAVGYSAGGGSGSAILSYPVTWAAGASQTLYIRIGTGGVRGGCGYLNNDGGPPYVGSEGGNTVVTIGSMNLTAYAGAGGGSNYYNSQTMGSAYGGGGGGSASSGGDDGAGGAACTSSTEGGCPAGLGPSGASSPQQVSTSESTCYSPAGTTFGYWTSGGAGAFCDYDSSVYSPVRCSTSDWGGTCLNTTSGCSGTISYYSSTSESFGTVPDSGTVINCAGAGAPGVYGSTASIANSGAGGMGCTSAVIMTNLASGYQDYNYLPTCNECYAEDGAAGGAMIVYSFPSRTYVCCFAFDFMKKCSFFYYHHHHLYSQPVPNR